MTFENLKIESSLISAQFSTLVQLVQLVQLSNRNKSVNSYNFPELLLIENPIYTIPLFIKIFFEIFNHI